MQTECGLQHLIMVEPRGMHLVEAGQTQKDKDCVARPNNRNFVETGRELFQRERHATYGSGVAGAGSEVVAICTQIFVVSDAAESANEVTGGCCCHAV